MLEDEGRGVTDGDGDTEGVGFGVPLGEGVGLISVRVNDNWHAGTGLPLIA